MKRSIATLAVACALMGALLVAPPALAHSEAAAQAKPEAAPEMEAKSVKVKLLDLELLDQDGNRVKFKSDVVKDRLVVIDAIYTTCPIVCPLLSTTFASLQDSLGDRLGKEVVLVSISVDPITDVPPRLKAYAARYKARPGWVFLTGEKSNVDQVLRGLGAYAPDFAEHPTMILVGDSGRGGWTRFYDFPAPDKVLAKLDELRARRQAKTP